MFGQMFGSLVDGFGLGGLFGRSGGGAIAPVVDSVAPQFSNPNRSIQDTARAVFGAPRLLRDNLSRDQIVSDIIMFPYRNWQDQGNYGDETGREREFYRTQYRRDPIVKSAIRGKTTAASSLSVAVLPNKHGPRKLCNEIADFIEYTIGSSPGGWVSLIDNVYSSAPIDGFSICTKKLKLVRWKNRMVWGYDHTRQLDSKWLRMQLDVFRKPVAMVNMVRGLEYYSPEDVILYSHNMQYSDPFGIPDMTCITRESERCQTALMMWDLAVEHYGLPFMVGTAGQPTQKEALGESLQGLRDGGWVVIAKGDEIKTLDLAAAAGGGGAMFEKLLTTSEERIFQGARGSSLPFKEGKGGKDSHGDTDVSKGVSESQEYHDVLLLANTIQHQLFTFMVEPNWGGDPDLIPTLRLGGTNWKETKEIIGVLSEYKEKLDGETSKEYMEKVLTLPPPRDEDDRPGTDQADQVELKGQREGLAAIVSLQTAFYAGQIPQAAAIANLVNLFGYTQQEAAGFFPTVLPVNRAAAAEAKAQPPAPPALPAGPGATAPTQPATFSADHQAGWEDDVEKLIKELKGNVA